MTLKGFLKDTAKGTAIGASCLIPGISGGTIAIFLRIYQKIIDNVASLTSKFKKSFLQLLPIVLGIVLGVVAMWVPLHLAIKYFLFGVLCLFGGFIIGGLPSLYKPIKGNKILPRHIIAFLIPFVFVITISVLSVFFKINADSQFTQPYKYYLYFELIGVGVLGAFALVIPGISGSMIFLILGFYDNILALIENFKNKIYIVQTIGLFLCLVLGILIGVILVSKLMKAFIAKHELVFSWGVFGFVIGSIFSMFYNNNVLTYFKTLILWEGVVGFVLLILGFVSVLLFTKYVDKKILINENIKGEENDIN